MKIAVLGTSNSILVGGYTAGIASVLGAGSVDNYSLGASTSVVLPKVMSERKFDDYRYVIIEFAVNEETWVRINATSISFIEETLDYFLSTLSRNTVPVVVIMPTTMGLGKNLPVHQFYRDYAIKHKFPLFDCFEYLKKTFVDKDDLAPLFMDVEHLRRETAFDFGKYIAVQLQNIPNDFMVELVKAPNDVQYQFLRAEEFKTSDASIIERSSSLTSAKFAKVDQDSAPMIEFEKPVSIIGVGVNLAQSTGRLAFTSASETREFAFSGNHFKGDGKSLIYTITPMREFSGAAFKLAPSSVADVIEVGGVIIRKTAASG